MVASYCRVLAETRVKRSTRCRSFDTPMKAVLGEKFVVSTTSVSPSQWPRESPIHCRIAVRHVRAAVHRDDAGLVDGLHQEDDVGRRLDDPIHAAVGRLETRDAEGEAALAQAAALGTVGRMQPALFDRSRATRLRRRRLGRNAAVRRVDDERGAVVDVAVREPEAVVVAGLGVVRGGLLLALEGIDDELVAEQGVAALFELRARLLELLDFRVGERSSCRPTPRAAAAA